MKAGSSTERMELAQIEIKLARATTLPILPNVVTQVLALTEAPSASARDYERVITQDAALAVKILRTANSTYFGGNGHITTLKRAVTQLGNNTIRSICLTVAFQSAVNAKMLNKRFDPASFWKHSLAVACASKVLACLTQSFQTEEAFIAGLVHDIGKLALCMFLPLEANQVYAVAESQKLSQFEAEEKCLSLTHQEIGRLAAVRWGLPEIYLAPISKHHTPTDEIIDIDPLTAFVHIGNALAHEIGLGYAPTGQDSLANPLVVDFLGISEAQYEPLRNAIRHEIKRISDLMGLSR